ncbi:hypothetical protein M3Y96_00075900 [Aphelenchoides besseyi]|nr:hypothetical protein M3Y96_00075900 [Aphelenchoides besseyi]
MQLHVFSNSAYLFGICLWLTNSPFSIAIFQVGPERPLDFKIRSCSLQQPISEDTMLFFPDNLKFCSSIRTSKSVVSLAKDRQRTTFLQPMGYGGEYRFSPDLGWYPACQKPISNYVSQLAVSPSNSPVWNVTNSHCPIQSLPSKYRDYLSCDLVKHRWYELSFKSSIRYEVFHKRRYHQAWANHSTAFIFKPDNFVERNGTELGQKHCERARYLIKVDEAFPLPLTVFIDYRIKEDGYIKFLKHLGNGTLDNWFSGAFALEKSDRIHEVCVQVSYPSLFNFKAFCSLYTREASTDTAYVELFFNQMNVDLGQTVLQSDLVSFHFFSRLLFSVLLSKSKHSDDLYTIPSFIAVELIYFHWINRI